MDRSPSCSDLTRLAGEPLAGTAPHARTWVAWEYAGPWGRRALDSERLDGAVRDALVALSRAPGISVVLVRRPVDFMAIAEPVVLIAHADATRPIGIIAPQPDPADLHTWDVSALATGRLPDLAGQQSIDDPVLLVCTHSSRDACCAIEGRGLVTALRAGGVSVWESSHLGGHRFAPTALLLPDGAVYGRLDPGSATALMQDGRVDLVHARGLSGFTASEQVAELAVRAAVGERTRGVLAAVDGEDHQVTVTHVDGRTWLVDVERTVGITARPESCGGEPSLPAPLACTNLRLVTARTTT